MAANPNQSDTLDRLNGLTEAELAVLDGVVAGTRTASKVLVVDASGTIDALDIDAPSILGVVVTATAPELNLLDNQVASATFVVGADAGTTVEVNVQFKDAAGVDMATPVSLDWYYSSDSAGLDPLTAAHDGGSAAGTDGALIENVANLSGRLISEADGDFDIIATDAGAFTSHLVIVMPNGSLAISTVMTHNA